MPHNLPLRTQRLNYLFLIAALVLVVGVGGRRYHRQRLNQELLAAIKQHDLKSVKSLIEQGADMYAVTGEYEEMSFSVAMAYLHESLGPEPDIAPRPTYPPPQLAHTGDKSILIPGTPHIAGASLPAYYLDSKPVADWLFEHSPRVGLPTKAAIALAMEAVARGRGDVIADVLSTLQPGEQGTILREAALHGDPDTVRVLLERGVPVTNGADANGTVLYWAASGNTSRRRNDVIALLLAHGSEPNETSANHVTPLMGAATNNLAATELLLVRGAQANVQDAAGQTPLFLAAQSGRADTTSLLLSQGADPLLARSDGSTPHQIALQYHHKDVATLLAKAEEKWRPSRKGKGNPVAH